MKRLLSALLAVAVCATAPEAVADDGEDGDDPGDAILDALFGNDSEYLALQREWEELEANEPDEADKAYEAKVKDLVARQKQWHEAKLEEIKNGSSEEIDEDLVKALEAAIHEDDDEEEDGGGDDDWPPPLDDDGNEDDGDAGSGEIPKMPDGFVKEAAANLTLDAGPDPAAGCR